MASKPSSSCVLGIDFGSTNTCCAVYKNKKEEVVPNELGNKQTPSIVSFQDADVLIGDSARSQQFKNPTNTFTDIKETLGLDMKSLQDFIQSEDLPIIAADKDGAVGFTVKYKGKMMVFSVEEVATILLTKVHMTAAEQTKQKIQGVVLAVPPTFSDKQRQAVKDAGVSSGMDILRVTTDPFMAATAYGLSNKDETTVLVFDMGANAARVTIMEIEEGIFAEIGTKTSRKLGGNAIDLLIADHLIEEFNQKFKVNMRTDRTATSRVRLACEKIKTSIWNEVFVNIDIPSLFNKVDFKTTLTKAKFEQLTSKLLHELDIFIDESLKSSSVKPGGIKDVVMVGGGSKMKRIQEILKKKFGGGTRFHCSIDPQEVVAIGCARQAEMWCPSSEKLSDLLLLDVEPLSLGVDTADGIMSTIFPRNSTIPGRKTQTFTTMYDDQVSMTFKIYEGERLFSEDNIYVGMFDITGIKPSPRGTQTISLTFDIDANGVLSITAQDNESKRSVVYKTFEIKAQLDYEELEELINEADDNQTTDAIAVSRIHSKQSLEDLVYFINSSLPKLENVDSENKRMLQSKCNEISDWLDTSGNQDQVSLDSKRKELEYLCSKIRSTGSMLDNFVPISKIRVPGRIKTRRKSKKVSWW